MQLIVSGGMVVPQSLEIMRAFALKEETIPSLVDLEENPE